MNIRIKKSVKPSLAWWKWGAFTVVSIFSIASYSQTVDQYRAIPPSLAENTPPLIMLAMSVDHQLFFKAYTDYEDLDGADEAFPLETTYENNIEYAGYFDSTLCYVYSELNGRYEPDSVITHTLDVDGNISARGYCNEGVAHQWSGNFLNWATMTRIDQVRSILYGGYRSEDSSSLTVLERAHLTTDAHSFPKYYGGSDLASLAPFPSVSTGTGIDDGITICNTTPHAGPALSQDVNDAPLARVVEGNYSLWASNERWQCLYEEEQVTENGNNPAVTGINAHNSNPSVGDQAAQAAAFGTTTVGDYVVRVLVCDENYVDSAFSTHDCTQYPDGNYKPIGLLQEYGEDSSALWGLISGSYVLNKSGGVLRKDIGDVTDEVNVETDGTFLPSLASGGIISSLNSLRIANYSYGDGTYNEDGCEFGITSFPDGNCVSWGNPFAEILLECYRYFAGATPNGGFNANDTSLGGVFTELRTDSTWDNPQTEDTNCASLNVIAFNASGVSYDNDALAGISDLGNPGRSAAEFTSDIGSASGENIHGGQYFVGDSGVGAARPDYLCTAKTISDLGAVEGTCPASPRLEGSYNSAGLAYHAHISDLRPGTTEFPGDQTVTTYGVTMSPGVPNISIPLPGSASGQTVSILPSCKNTTEDTSCGLVEFSVVSQTSTATTQSGLLFVTWEAAEQGGDYDQDLNGIVRYTLTNSVLTVTTDTIAITSSRDLAFGYVLSGTTDDGFHAHSGANGVTLDACRGCEAEDAPTTQSYTVGTSTASLLEQPLWYAAKWGGFTDVGGSENNIPDEVAEWDSDGDGTPDNYVTAVNPRALKESLGEVIRSILERTSSGTAAAVNAQTGSGEGAIYQALYTPRIKEDGSDLVSWIGTLRGFFIDEFARVREDTNGNDALDDGDNVIEFDYDANEQITTIQAYTANTDGSIGAPVGEPYEISDFTQASPIWDAQLELANLTNITANRAGYDSLASTGRYIFTAIDRAGGGEPADGQVILPAYSPVNSGQSGTEDIAFPFVAGNFATTGPTANDHRYLGFGDDATNEQVENLVNFIRGDETIDGDRNRTLDSTSLILGDIVHSTPAVVSRPRARYDLIYGDETYREYVDYYRNRRSVVYVGANDGMLHAFNSGFFNSENSTFELERTGEVQHPLGSELWAYVPYNLLPHLQWLQDDEYPHVYYVDGPVQTFDVNIFDPSEADHPGGWGTILVVGMRFGGGDYTFDHDGDAVTDDITTRSAYIIMDVTNPEEPPELIAEITDEDLGFTIEAPTVVKYRKRASSGTFSNTGANGWYLVFGSGPAGNDDTERLAALDDGVSYKSAKAYAFNLTSRTLDMIEIQNEAREPELDSFTSGFESIDWDRDFDDDAIYYGLVAGDAATPEGKLKRARLDFSPSGALGFNAPSFSTDLFNDFSRAFSATPRATLSNGERWIYAGTGRFLVPDDNLSNQQQYYFGIKEPLDANGEFPMSEAVDADRLLDTTNIDVYEDGRVRDENQNAVVLSASSVTEQLTDSGTFDDVREFIADNAEGWYFAFETPPHDENALMRNITQAARAGESIIISAYEATNQVCTVTGEAFLFAPHLEAGIPAPFSPLGTDSNYTLTPASGSSSDPDVELVLQGRSIGEGMPSEPVVVPAPIPSSDCSGYRVFVQTTTGELGGALLNCEGIPPGRQGWREIPVTW